MPKTQTYTIEDLQQRERSAPVVNDNEPHATWHTAFSYRRWLVTLVFATASFAVAVCSDVAKTAEEAKMVALRRARRNDPYKTLGKKIAIRVNQDTPEARMKAGVDDRAYDNETTWQNKWYEKNVMAVGA